MGYFKIENVNYKYPLEEKQALKNINIEIKKGEFWAVIGKNGSGKTTFCNMLRRFVPDFYKGELTGTITLEDKELKDYSQKELVQKIGFVFQNPFTQISGVKDTVFEEIAYGLENLGLDKPTSQLDPKGTEDIFKIINLMANEGKTIILVEHKLELIAEYAENILVLDEGEIILSGKAEEVLNNKILLEKEIGMTQYSILAYELEKAKKVEFEEIPITKEKTIELLKEL